MVQLAGDKNEMNDKQYFQVYISSLSELYSSAMSLFFCHLICICLIKLISKANYFWENYL